MRLTFCKLFVLLVLFCSYAVSRITAQLTTPNGLDFKATSSFVAEIEALDPMLRGAGDASFVAPFTNVFDGLGAFLGI